MVQVGLILGRRGSVTRMWSTMELPAWFRKVGKRFWRRVRGKFWRMPTRWSPFRLEAESPKSV